MFANRTFANSLTALVVAAALGLSVSAAQARDFDHRGGHGFQQTQHHGNSRHGHRSDHHRGTSHHGGRHDGRR